MAHIALAQAELKAAAGIKATGRKLEKTRIRLQHRMASGREGRPRPSRSRRRGSSIEAQGLEGHQAIILCHDDEPQAHVHIIVNRVHPATGKSRHPLEFQAETLAMGGRLRAQAREGLLPAARQETTPERRPGRVRAPSPDDAPRVLNSPGRPATIIWGRFFAATAQRQQGRPFARARAGDEA